MARLGEYRTTNIDESAHLLTAMHFAKTARNKIWLDNPAHILDDEPFTSSSVEIESKYRCDCSAVLLSVNEWKKVTPYLTKPQNGDRPTNVSFIPPSLPTHSLHSILLRQVAHDEHRIHQIHQTSHDAVYRRIEWLIWKMHEMVKVPMKFEDVAITVEKQEILKYVSEVITNTQNNTSILNQPANQQEQPITHYIDHARDAALREWIKTNLERLKVEVKSTAPRIWKGSSIRTLIKESPGDNKVNEMEATIHLPGVGSFTVYECEYNGSVMCPFRILNCDSSKTTLDEFNNPWNARYHGYRYGNKSWVIRNNDNDDSIYVSSLSWHLLGKHHYWYNVTDHALDMTRLVRILRMDLTITDAMLIPNEMKRMKDQLRCQLLSTCAGSTSIDKYVTASSTSSSSLPKASSVTSPTSSPSISSLKLCNGCAKSAPLIPLQICSRCHLAHYCSRTCQSSDWPQHRSLCNQYKT